MTTSHAGRFVWRDLMTTNKDAATAFYRGLFGWDNHDMDMGPMGTYTMVRSGENDLGGVVPLDKQGIPSHWISYITVDDVDSACALISELGGQVHVEPFDIPNVGRTAVATDPAGAFFSPFKGLNPGETDTERRPPDFTFCWTQLNAHQAADLVGFYTQVFGWTASPMPSEGPRTWLLNRGDQMTATIMELPKDNPAPAHWLPYVAVPDVADYHNKATELGATSMRGPTAIPNMGTFAVLSDPSSAYIALWTNEGAGTEA